MAKTKLKVHRDDLVMVIAGKHKGRTGKVVRVFPEEGRVIVEGIALVKRHMKPQQDRPGSIIEKERPIHVSNVVLWNAEEGRKVKIGFKVEDGKKLRVDRKTGAVI